MFLLAFTTLSDTIVKRPPRCTDTYTIMGKEIRLLCLAELYKEKKKPANNGNDNNATKIRLS